MQTPRFTLSLPLPTHDDDEEEDEDDDDNDADDEEEDDPSSPLNASLSLRVSPTPRMLPTPDAPLDMLSASQGVILLYVRFTLLNCIYGAFGKLYCCFSCRRVVSAF